MKYSWYESAQKERGTQEIKGKEDNPRIVQYFADVYQSGIQDDDTPWCAAFVGAMLERNGIRSTRMLNAQSYLNWGVEITKPVPGCIVVMKRGKKAWMGHVTFYDYEDDKYIYCTGGNQGDKVGQNRYLKDDKILGYRLPKTKANSKTMWASGAGVVTTIGSQTEGISKTFEDITDKVSQATGIVDMVGGITSSINPTTLLMLAVGAMFLFVMYERNKKLKNMGA